jgi:hypothetical protein
MNKINNYTIVPLGHACEIAKCLNILKIRNTSFRFDWLRTYELNQIFTILKEDYNNDILDNIIKNEYPYNFYINNKYKILHFHDDFNNIIETKMKFNRRINRLKSLIHSYENILFVRYYPLDYHSYYCSFFEYPNIKQSNNKIIDEEILFNIIIDDCNTFNKYYNKYNIKFMQIIPFKINKNIKYNNTIQVINNKSFQDIMNDINLDPKNNKYIIQHIENTFKYLKKCLWENLKDNIILKI